MMKRLLVGVFLFLGLAATSTHADYYVSSGGSDGNNCTISSTPCATLTHVADVMANRLASGQQAFGSEVYVYTNLNGQQVIQGPVVMHVHGALNGNVGMQVSLDWTSNCDNNVKGAAAASLVLEDFASVIIDSVKLQNHCTTHNNVSAFGTLLVQQSHIGFGVNMVAQADISMSILLEAEENGYLEFSHTVPVMLVNPNNLVTGSVIALGQGATMGLNGGGSDLQVGGNSTSAPFLYLTTGSRVFENAGNTILNPNNYTFTYGATVRTNAVIQLPTNELRSSAGYRGLDLRWDSQELL